MKTSRIVTATLLIGSIGMGWISIKGHVAANAQSAPPAAPIYKTPVWEPTAPSVAPPAAPSTPTDLMATLRQAERDNNADALVYSYGQAVTDARLARGALALLMSDYYRMRAQATTADQASQAVDEAALRFAVMRAAQNQATVQQNQTLIQQNEVIIEQNQRIIELLAIIVNRQ
ncbi:MAG: hypothetical protein M3347_10615 [Armatimonadota bacterium]|nr:hypothetical protein [Armatimonadota bacterium]